MSAYTARLRVGLFRRHIAIADSYPRQGRMWKRINKDRQPETAMGSSAFIETVANENTLQGTTNINNGSFSISSRPAFGRKRTEDVLKGLPALPLYAPLPTRKHSRLTQKATNCTFRGSQMADHYQKHLLYLLFTRNLHRSYTTIRHGRTAIYLGLLPSTPKTYRLQDLHP